MANIGLPVENSHLVVENGAIQTSLAVPVYGIEWDQGTDTWTRLDSASGLTRSSFDSIYPWSDITRVNMAHDGTINARWGDAGYAHDGSNGEVMVEIPKFYMKSTNRSSNVYRWWIAPGKPDDTWDVHPMFNQRTSSPPADYVYIGAYEAYDDGNLHSESGVEPTASQTLETFRGHATNNGTGWGLQNFWSRMGYTFLFMVEYGSLDSQSLLDDGIVDASDKHNTGADDIDNQIGSNGIGTGTGTSGATPVCYRYIENPWGNLFTFVDGYQAVDGGYRLLARDGSWSSLWPSSWSSSDYEETTADPINSNGYIDNIEYEDLLNYGLLGASTDGSDTTYIPDYQYSHDSGEENILLVGGSWSYGSGAGLVYLASGFESSSSPSGSGARVEFIG